MAGLLQGSFKIIIHLDCLPAQAWHQQSPEAPVHQLGILECVKR